MGCEMMKIWSYVPIILLILLCGGVTAEEAVFTSEGDAVERIQAGDIVFTTPENTANGIEILAVSKDPDEYTVFNTVTVDTTRFDLSSESCGGTEKQITFGALNHVNPRVSDGRVVFEEWSSGVSAIGLYDIDSGGLFPVYPGKLQQSNPDISGRIVVYEQAGATANPITNIFGYDLQTDTAAAISSSTSNQNNPVISGRYITWVDWRKGNADIYMADLNSGSSQYVTKDLSEQKNPDISGNYIIWEDWRNGNADIYLYDIVAEKEYQLTNDPNNQRNPRISGKIIVWEDDRNGISDIFAMTLDTFQEYQLTDSKYKAVKPDVSGPLVAWEDYRNGNADIYLLDLVTGRIYQITTNQGDQKSPSIYGNYLVWQDYRTGNSNIFLYTFSSSTKSGNYQLYGSATVEGSAVPVGTKISALIDGAIRASYTVQQAGQYGSTYGPYLEIPVYSTDSGKTITFRINDYQADQTITVGSGGIAKLDLSASYSPLVQTYTLSGNVLINNIQAPVGTVLSASIDSQIRGQVTVTSSGTYSGFNIPVNQNDIGKTIVFTTTSGGSYLQAAQSITVGQQVSGWLDLTFGTTPIHTTYSFSGSALLDGQYAPAGTVISAVIDNQIRGQATITSTGLYSSLNFPVYQSDNGKYLSFTAQWSGATYVASQKVTLSTQQGDIIIASADVSTESSLVQKRLDLTFTTSSQTKYNFWGRANLDGYSMPTGNTIYALIDNQIRGQISILKDGSYGSEYGPYLEVPITSADIGKTIRFQTASGAEGDQSQLVVSGLKVQKNINFNSKSSTSADFTATPTQGNIPLTVKFTDRSSGNSRAWYWDFGDGTTSTERNPTHVYTRSGVYSVGLMTTQHNGQTKTAVKQNLITAGIVSPPEAQVTLNTGWNFISVPKMLIDGQNTAKALFEHVEVGGHSIFTYNPRSKTWNTVNANTIINPLDAVWIYSTKTDAVYLYFAEDALQIPPTRKLVKGWNTFGVTSLNTVPAQNALLSVRDQWIYVIGFDSSIQRYQSTIMNVQESNTNALYPGYGYWIYMSEDGDLAAIGI
ncbi:MAG: PKD domain-containing protein [Methanomicrobiales archaeon]|nr:PKD domain-containing protein [Methanomicrobiales archaeon]